MFAIENIAKEIGTIEAKKISWDKNQTERTETPVKLVSCDDLLPGQSNNEALNLKDMFKGRKKSDLLCPVGEDSMPLEGNFGADRFDYF